MHFFTSAFTFSAAGEKSAGPNMVCEPLPGIEPDQWIVTMAVGSAGAPVPLVLQWTLVVAQRESSSCLSRVLCAGSAHSAGAMSPTPPATVTGLLLGGAN